MASDKEAKAVRAAKRIAKIKLMGRDPETITDQEIMDTYHPGLADTIISSQMKARKLTEDEVAQIHIEQEDRYLTMMRRKLNDAFKNVVNIDATRYTPAKSTEQIIADNIWKPSDVPEHGIDRIIGPFAAAGFVTVIGAPGGTGKSTAMGTTAVGIAAGQHIVGWGVNRKARVAYLQAEDNTDMVRRALRAIAQEHAVFDKDVEERLMVLGADRVREWLGKETQALQERREGGVKINPSFMGKLREMIQLGAFDVVVIDPLAVLYGGAKVTNEAQNLLIRAFGDLAEELMVSIILVVHMRKLDPNKKAHVSDLKHGGELSDAARIVSVMNRLTKAEQDEWRDRQEHDPKDVVELKIGKSNIGPDGIRTFMAKKVQQVTCQDGSVEDVVVMVPAIRPFGRQEQADFDLWKVLQPILDERFIGKRKSTHADSLKEVVDEIDDGNKYDTELVIKDMFQREWITEVKENPKSATSRTKIIRIIAGLNAPDLG